MANGLAIFGKNETGAIAVEIAHGTTPPLTGRPSSALNHQGDHGVTLLIWALLHDNMDALKALLRTSADPSLPDEYGQTVMHLAASTTKPDALIHLLAALVDPDMRNARTRETPIFDAIKSDRKAQFGLLLQAGADLNAQDDMGNTPLHIAATTGLVGYVSMLLEAGADPQMTNEMGRTFLPAFTLTPLANLNAEARQERERVIGLFGATNGQEN